MEQDRIHIKLARRTPEERQADETRRLDPIREHGVEVV